MGEGLVIGRDIKMANQQSPIQDTNMKATSGELIRRLLSTKWTKLLANHSSLDGQSCKGGEDPGVYLLAYSDKDLQGKDIDLEDIFYVGMSNSHGGVNQRLKQFIDAIERGSKG